MNKINLFLALCIALLFSACATDIESIVDNNAAKGEKKKMVFTAEKAPIATSSRATVQDDYSILWDEGDVVIVFDGKNKNTFTLVSGAGTTCAQFAGEALEADRYVAVYGDGPLMTLENNTLSGVSISNIMTNEKKNKHTMLAVSDASNNMLFKSGNSFVNITTLAPTKCITIIGGENDVLGSYYNYTFDDTGNIINISSKYDRATLSDSQKSSLAPNYVYHGCANTQGTHLIPIASTTLSRMEVVVESVTGNFLSRTISHDIHNFETPGTVIDFGTVSEENGWKKRQPHQEEICVQHYALGQGKENALQIDLGLPSGLKWSSVNLGATSPEKYGDYYAWGATVPWLESYDQDGNIASITTSAIPLESPLGVCKWISNYHPGYVDAKTPFVIKTTNLQTDPNSWSKYFPGRDDKTVLEPEDDAAVQQWGDDWRMPTDEEFDELASNCYWEWCEDYKGTGIHGVIVYKTKQNADKGIYHNGSVWKKTVNGIDYAASSQPDGFTGYSISTDNNIFLPQPGLVDVRTIALSGEEGRYWSSTLSLMSVNSSSSNNARFLYFSSNGLYDQSAVGVGGNTGRVYGQPIRPVHP